MSTRKSFMLLVSVIGLLSLMAAQCAPPAVVEKQVVVTKEVIVTKEVEKEVVVEPDYVTLRTNWLFSGIHAWLFYGREKGYFKDENIVLDIREGNGSGNVVRTVINKDDDFALVSTQPPLISISQGAPIKFIYTWIGNFTWGYLCRPELNITDAKGLEGKVIVSSPGNAGIPAHPIFIEKAGLDPAKMQDLTLVDAGAMVSTVLTGKADCELGGVSDHLPLWEAEGVTPTVVWMRDYGIAGPATGVITHQDMIDNNPDLVARLVRALQKSQMECGQDVEGCVNALITAHPMMDFDTQLSSLELSIDDWLGANQDCVGQFVKENWDFGYQLLKEVPDSAIEGDKPIEDFYTDQFVPACP
jgi:NitT/TauT family transport system substrate-binding protein